MKEQRKNPKKLHIFSKILTAIIESITKYLDYKDPILKFKFLTAKDNTKSLVQQYKANCIYYGKRSRPQILFRAQQQIYI